MLPKKGPTATIRGNTMAISSRNIGLRSWFMKLEICIFSVYYTIVCSLCVCIQCKPARSVVALGTGIELLKPFFHVKPVKAGVFLKYVPTGLCARRSSHARAAMSRNHSS